VPFGNLPANFSLTFTQKCQLPFGELAPIIHTVPSSVEGFYQLVPVRIDLPFELELKVPPVGSSALVTIQYQPDPITYSNQSMGHSSAQQGAFDPTALVAATAANTAAIGTMVSAINAQPGLIADAIDNNAYDTSAVNPPPVVGLVATLVLAADTTRVKANFRNESASSSKTIKIFASTVPLTSAALALINYSTLNSLDELLKGDSWESLEGESKSNFYAISAAAGANLAITTTRTV
jgi:hypothetical protein